MATPKSPKQYHVLPAFPPERKLLNPGMQGAEPPRGAPLPQSGRRLPEFPTTGLEHRGRQVGVDSAISRLPFTVRGDARLTSSPPATGANYRRSTAAPIEPHGQIEVAAGATPASSARCAQLMLIARFHCTIAYIAGASGLGYLKWQAIEWVAVVQNGQPDRPSATRCQRVTTSGSPLTSNWYRCRSAKFYTNPGRSCVTSISPPLASCRCCT
jgi:hypothetical protein